MAFISSGMIVGNFHGVGISAVPFKTDPPLIVDGYTILPSLVADKSV
jgi:hypothetical protein